MKMRESQDHENEKLEKVYLEKSVQALEQLAQVASAVQRDLGELAASQRKAAAAETAIEEQFVVYLGDSRNEDLAELLGLYQSLGTTGFEASRSALALGYSRALPPNSMQRSAN